MNYCFSYDSRIFKTNWGHVLHSLIMSLHPTTKMEAPPVSVTGICRALNKSEGGQTAKRFFSFRDSLEKVLAR